MSVKFSIAKMKNPQKPEEAAKFFAKAQARETVDINKIADELAYATSLTDGDILNVIRGLIRKVKEHMADGDIVSLGEFGTFQIQLSSNGAVKEEDFIAANITKARIQFRPGELLREVTNLKTLKFEKVISVKARKEAAKKQVETPPVE